MKDKLLKSNSLLKSIFIGMITGMANGLFGSGGGTIVVPAMTCFLQVEEHKAHATAIFIILPLTMTSAWFYISNQYVDWSLTWKVVLGGMLGGFLGAKLLKRLPSGLLRKIFGIFMIIAAIRMMF